MYQAITIKYLGPTNTKGGRYKASACGHSVTVEIDHALNSEANVKAAAEAFKAKHWTLADDVELVISNLDGATYVATVIPSEFIKAREAVCETRLAMLRGHNNGNPHLRLWGKLVSNLTDPGEAFSEAFIERVKEEENDLRRPLQ